MDVMLENGSWLLRNVPLILKRLSPYVNLMKEDVCNVPFWVNINYVPITAFTKDVLSAIATKQEEEGVIQDLVHKRRGKYKVEESDSEVEDIDEDTNQFMASILKRSGGGANDASLLKDEDYSIYDGYENDSYDLSQEQLAFL
nr:hypothetical protein [Tanacetum cinerariifolium]